MDSKEKAIEILTKHITLLSPSVGAGKTALLEAEAILKQSIDWGVVSVRVYWENVISHIKTTIGEK